MKSNLLFILLALLLSTYANAGSRFDTLEFLPNIEIHKKTNSSSLEIVTEDNYTATYDMAQFTFEPLEMKFKVISTGVLPEKHVIEYVFQEHYCQDDGSGVETPIEGVELSLNGKKFTDNYAYQATVDTVLHTLKLDFPFIQPKYVEQVCYGMVGFTLKLDSL